MPPICRTERGEAGFTLLELLITLTIAVMLVAALPGLGGQPLALDGAARALVRDLRAAQIAARESGAPQRLVFEARARRYGRVGGASVALPAGLGMEVLTGRAAGDTDQGITFFPDGSSTGGAVTLREGARQRRIEVRWLTGQVRQSDG